jgi:cbb3-type cytochrome oxidase subunit 3
MENKKSKINLFSEKKNIIFAVFAFVLFILFISSIWFIFLKVREESYNLFEEKNRIFILEQQDKEIENFKSEYDNYLPNFKKIEEMFVDPKNPLSFIEFLEKISIDANVNLEISPLSFLTEGTSKFVTVKLFINGEFNNLLSFLENMENGNYLVSIDNLIISNYEEKTESANVVKKSQASITIKAITK